MPIELAQDQSTSQSLMERNKEICELFKSLLVQHIQDENLFEITISDDFKILTIVRIEIHVKAVFTFEEDFCIMQVFSNGYKNLKEFIDNEGIVPIVEYEEIPAFEIKYPIHGNFEEEDAIKCVNVIGEAAVNTTSLYPITADWKLTTTAVIGNTCVFFFINDLASSGFTEQYEVAKESIEKLLGTYNEEEKVLVFYDSVVELIDRKLFELYFNEEVYAPVML
jgi:hypothetical protein